jgi:hypothetical protein
LVEHRIRNAGVTSSNLVSGTTCLVNHLSHLGSNRDAPNHP